MWVFWSVCSDTGYIFSHTCLPGCHPTVCSCTSSCQLQCSSEPLPEDWTRQSFLLPPLEKRKENRKRVWEISSAGEGDGQTKRDIETGERKWEGKFKKEVLRERRNGEEEQFKPTQQGLCHDGVISPPFRRGHWEDRFNGESESKGKVGLWKKWKERKMLTNRSKGIKEGWRNGGSVVGGLGGWKKIKAG